MAEYQVIFKGTKDPTLTGKHLFLEKFAAKYKMEPKPAESHIKARQGVLFSFTDYDQACKAKVFLENIGAVAAIRVIEDNIPAPEKPGELPGPTAAPPTAAEAKAESALPEPAMRACPRCGRTAPAGREDCPYCHVMMAKYEERQRQAAAASSDGINNASLPGAPIFPGQTAASPAVASSRPLAASPPAAPAGYSFSFLLISPFRVYFQSFRAFFTILSLNLAPTILVLVAGKFGEKVAASFHGGGESSTFLVGILLLAIAAPVGAYIVNYFTCAVCLAIQDVVMGKDPSPVRSLRAVPPLQPLKLIATLMLILALAAVVVSLVVAGASWFHGSRALAIAAVIALVIVIIAYASMTMLAYPITVLEKPWHFRAILRSVQLGRGHYFRNFMVMCTFSLAFVLCYLLLLSPILVVYGLGVGMEEERQGALNFISVFSSIVRTLTAPLWNILIIALYFDMRLRKEPRALQEQIERAGSG